MPHISDYTNLQCPICIEVFDQPLITSCKHTFCNGCISTILTQSKAKCPICQRSLSQIDLRKDSEKHKIIATYTANCENCKTKIELSRMRLHLQQCKLTSMPSVKPVSSKRQPVTQNRSTFKCPYCSSRNLTSSDLIEHCNSQHKSQTKEVVCPICASMPWGDPNQTSSDFIKHLNLRHQFEYDTVVDFDQDDDAQLQAALQASLLTS